MKQILGKMWGLIAVTLIVPGVLGAQCANTSRDDPGLRKTDQEWISALRHKDVLVLGCLLADDFADSSWKGQFRPKAEVIRELPQRREFDQEVVVEKTSVHRSTGVVFGRNVIRSKDGKMLAAIRFTDAFVYEKGRWLAVAAQETAIENGR